MQIFTGRAPFQHLPEDELSRAVRDGIRPERPEAGGLWQRGLTNEVWRLLEWCWASEMKSRLRFEGIAQKLENCMRQRPTHDSALAVGLSICYPFDVSHKFVGAA